MKAKIMKYQSGNEVKKKKKKKGQTNKVLNELDRRPLPPHCDFIL
jgi:hypothetical protein